MQPLDPDALAAFTRPAAPGSHRVELRIGERTVDTLADLPPQPNRLLFVGVRPSPASVEAGHHHRDGGAFWSRLADAGILPEGTDPATADDVLVAAGHGLTDLHKDPTADADAPDAVLRAGVGHLWQRVALWRPAAIVFIEKRAADAVAGRDLRERYGVLEGVAVGGRPCVLMPASDAPAEDVEEGVLVLRNLLASLPR